MLKDGEDVVSTWKLKRTKTQGYYYTFTTPEATHEIIHSLLSDERVLSNKTPLFKFTTHYAGVLLHQINEKLGLGVKGTYGRFRCHMLRKFHSSSLQNHEKRLTLDEIDFIQGRVKSKTREHIL